MELTARVLTEKEQLITEFVKALSKRYDRKYWLAKSEKREFPQEMWDEIARNGYFGMIIPEEYGGANSKFGDVRLLIQELAKYGIATLHFISFFMDCAFLVKHCNSGQKRRFLPELASGTYISSS